MTTPEPSRDSDLPVQVAISDIEDFIREAQERDDSLVNSDVDVAKLLFIIDKETTRLDRLKQGKSDYLDWFSNQINSVQGNIDFLKAHLQGYVEAQPETKVSTPNGTAYITKRKSIDWAPDDVLLEWSKGHHVPIRIKEAPDKTELKKHFEETNELPTGCMVSEKVSLSIRG